MPQRDIVVIGGSADALEAVATIAVALPSSPAGLLVVIHTRARSNAVLPEILSCKASLPVEFATDNAPLTRGHAAAPNAPAETDG
jgi:chemotaxis response regulator CheB